MEGHAIFRDEFVHGRPPIELAHRRRIPRVAMRVVSVGDTCRKIISGERTAQTWHILVCLIGRAAKGTQHGLYEFLRTRVVDVTGLQYREDLDASFDGQALVSTLRIERGERVLDHAASVFYQREHLRRWRQANDVSVVNHLAPGFVIARRIEKYVGHGAPFLIIVPILVCNDSTSSCLVHITLSLVAIALAEG